MTQRQPKSGNRRAVSRCVLAIGTILLTGTLLGGGPAPRKIANSPVAIQPNPSTPLTNSPATGGDRLREGSKVADEIGHFELQGDRATFVSKTSKLKLGCLENLGLERVAQVVSDNLPNQVEWTVHGTITEFRGSHYLLISEAVLKTKPNRAAN